jgi:hypothetical protein
MYALYDDNGELIRYSKEQIAGSVPTKPVKPIMKQGIMFDVEESLENEYTSKVSAPIYEPKNVKPHILQLCDKSRAKRLMQSIKDSSVSDAEKEFLFDSAQRLNVFNYELIADYYAHSNAEMQGLMEDMALVIVDFDKAIELGFMQLSNDVRTQYLEFYDES